MATLIGGKCGSLRLRPV